MLSLITYFSLRYTLSTLLYVDESAASRVLPRFRSIRECTLLQCIGAQLSDDAELWKKDRGSRRSVVCPNPHPDGTAKGSIYTAPRQNKRCLQQHNRVEDAWTCHGKIKAAGV